MKRFFNIRFLSCAAVFVFFLCYSLLSNFSFLPITEGWFSAYAHLVNAGKVPYRDFYLYLTPMYVWVVSLITYFFGPSLFILRVFGLLITCSIGLLLYKIFRYRFAPASSFVGATIATIYYQSGNAYISYDFTQILTLLSLLSFSSLLSAEQSLNFIDTENSRHKNNFSSAIISLIFSGLFASCAFLTKQSNGLFIVVFTFLSCLYLALTCNLSKNQKFKFPFYFLLGTLIPLSITITYLGINNALSQFIDQIFFNAIAAKGNLSKILSAWIFGVFTPVLKIQLFEIGRILLMVSLPAFFIFWIMNFNRNYREILKRLQNYRDIFILIIFFSLFITILICAWIDNSILRMHLFAPGRHLQNYLIPLSIGWLLIELSLIPIAHIIPSVLKKNRGTAALSICILGLFFGNGTSAGLSEISAFIAIGWIAAWLCDRGSIPLFGTWLSFYCCALLGTTLIYSKFDRPYAWWGASEPNTREATFEINDPVLRGIKLSKKTERIYSSAIDALKSINANSIFSFPNIPIFYLITDTWPNSKAIITWFDFLNDYDAITESNRLKENPPDAIIYLDLPEVAWKAHERLFRNGQPLGQRKIQAWINETCIDEKGYQIVLKQALDDQTTLYVCKKLRGSDFHR